VRQARRAFVPGGRQGFRFGQAHGRLGLVRNVTIISLAWLLLANASQVQAASTNGELRGIWMHATQIKTPADTEQAVTRIAAAHLNSVFLLVWYWGGQAYYRSDLCALGEGVAPGHDPLGAMVRACHARGIEVHAWFVNGEYGAPRPGKLLAQHPDWAVDAGGDELWYDFGKAAVRKFESDLMIECLSKYPVDGVHFDYIRYGPTLCYCKECQETFSKRYGFDVLSRGDEKTFPLFLHASGNRVVKPTTAQVIVKFADGKPAIAINDLGKGKVLLLNWHAEALASDAVKETVRRTLERWQAPRDAVYVLNTATNEARYGGSLSAAARHAFARLGYEAKSIQEDELSRLRPRSLLILPALYLIPDRTAALIEQFVAQGGTAVFIDGPVYSIGHPSLQRVLGMRESVPYFEGATVLTPAGENELAPSSGRVIDLEREQHRLQKWAEFRAAGVTELVRNVYRRAKAIRPKAEVTAAVFTPLAAAKRVCQDWPGWLREGIIDYVVPMAYTMDTADLGRQIAEWKTVDASLERILPGLSIYQTKDQRIVTRPVDLVVAQHRLCMEEGAAGTVYFSLHNLNETLGTAFRNGPYLEPASTYHPAPRQAR
jgi:uncharacterized lipoprotein YddW (UPF0748 family)